MSGVDFFVETNQDELANAKKRGSHIASISEHGGHSFVGGVFTYLEFGDFFALHDNHL